MNLRKIALQKLGEGRPESFPEERFMSKDYILYTLTQTQETDKSCRIAQNIL
jgi:hypothetical protein